MAMVDSAGGVAQTSSPPVDEGGGIINPFNGSGGGDTGEDALLREAFDRAILGIIFQFGRSMVTKQMAVGQAMTAMFRAETDEQKDIKREELRKAQMKPII